MHPLNLQTAVGGCPFNLQTAVCGCPFNLQTAMGGCPFNFQTAVGGCPFNLQTAVGGCPFNFPTARLKPGISGPWYSASVSSGILVSAASHLLPSLSARAMRVAMVLVGHNKLGLRGNCAYGT